jgi:hypothetical protein
MKSQFLSVFLLLVASQFSHSTGISSRDGQLPKTDCSALLESLSPGTLAMVSTRHPFRDGLARLSGVVVGRANGYVDFGHFSVNENLIDPSSIQIPVPGDLISVAVTDDGVVRSVAGIFRGIDEISLNTETWGIPLSKILRVAIFRPGDKVMIEYFPYPGRFGDAGRQIDKEFTTYRGSYGGKIILDFGRVPESAVMKIMSAGSLRDY